MTRFMLLLIIIAMIKTSLLAMAMLSMGLAIIGYGASRWCPSALSPNVRHRLQQLFICVLLLHASLYLGVIIKLGFIDSWQDIPTLILSHLILHHGLSAGIAGVATLLAVRVYLTARNERTLPPSH
ncbi:hypothetical protein [Shewanella sp. NIFS-20-20]|uniref:hypothetical protein n=1 Tax=Shewanella sp. NIFS-20-20 TaxID=2853806 RepID=UPI001C493E08|nr:hypothetical protein [Shewanella sp. NIFS-20-20]MBV7314064.1 hypothetical protein [Shewanella sp. NIFS-20-20]